MKKTLILSLFLLCSTNAYSTSELEYSNIKDDGPISNLMENLGVHTARVANELLTQLLANTEQTTKTLMGSIELVITSALNQLSQPIENFKTEISTSQCQPLITLEQLSKQIDADLAVCTQNLKSIVDTLQEDSNEIKAALEISIREIIDMPKKCQSVESEAGFGGTVSCYINNITDFNKQIAIILNNARETLAHTRQLGEDAVREGRTCTNNVIATTTDNLKKIMATCQQLAEEEKNLLVGNRQ